MSAVHAMPVSNQLPDGDHSIGTAFLARRGGEIFLVGAAHSPTRSQPHTRWLEWPSAFQVWRSPTENLTLPLFTGGFLRVPLFRFERRGPNSDLLSDMMAIPVSELHFGHLPSIDLTDDPPAPTPGTAVTVYGYPRSPRAPELALRVRDASRGDYSLCRAPSYFRRTNANCGRTFRRSRLRAFGDVRRHDDWPRR